MSDLVAEVSNDMGQINSRFQTISAGATKAKGSTREFGEEFERTFRNAGHHVRESSKEVEGMGHEIYELGHAVKGVGGAFGEIAHHLTGGFRMSGPMMAVAVSAGVAGVAIEALKGVTERWEEETKKAIETEEEYSRAIEKASEAHEEASLSAAERRAPGLKQIASRGGQADLDRASVIAKQAGIPLDDALKGVARGSLLPPKIQESAYAAGRLTSMTGDMPFSEAIEHIQANDPAGMNMRHMLANGRIHEVAARLQLSAQGRAPNRKNMDDAMKEQERAMTDRTGIVEQAHKLTDDKNKPAQQQIDEFKAGELRQRSVKESLNAMQPQFKAIQEENLKHEQHLAVLNRIADAVDTKRHENSMTGLLVQISEGFKAMGSFFGGAGSARQQANSEQDTFLKAILPLAPGVPGLGRGDKRE